MEGDPKLNKGIIALSVLLLLSIAVMLPRGLYGHHCLNILECCLLLNLGVLSITTAYVLTSNHKKKFTTVITSIAVYKCYSLWIFNELGLMARASSWVSHASGNIVTQGCSIREVHLMYWAPITSTCIPFLPTTLLLGARYSSIGGASHWRYTLYLNPHILTCSNNCIVKQSCSVHI